MPSTGKIEEIVFPGGPGVRVDTALKRNTEISPYYDSMIAKLITYGRNRKDAILKMKRALREFHIEGVKTNIGLHKRIMENDKFLKGYYSTDFISNFK